MAAIQERVAYVEGQVTELSLRLSGIEGTLQRLEHRVDGLDNKMSRQFVWLVGIQVTTLAAVVTALAAIIVAVLPAR